MALIIIYNNVACFFLTLTRTTSLLHKKKTEIKGEERRKIKRQVIFFWVLQCTCTRHYFFLLFFIFVSAHNIINRKCLLHISSFLYADTIPKIHNFSAMTIIGTSFLPIYAKQMTKPIVVNHPMQEKSSHLCKENDQITLTFYFFFKVKIVDDGLKHKTRSQSKI